MQSEGQSALSKIWTQITYLISSNDDHCTKYMYVCVQITEHYSEAIAENRR